ncbi:MULTISPECIES: hypothetical protein [unclassified Sphingomonas]|uniref:hypothetical protein n=1 Tax=Novosphingobium rhizosphaerae TaxID=1551649 RepID=UPI0015CAE5C2
MAVYRLIGEQVITEPEFRRAARDFSGLELTTPVEIGLAGGRTLSLDSAAPVADFHPIGIGLPLRVMISEVYTGRFPKSGLFGGSKDVAVVSGLRDYSSFSAVSRALNLIAPKTHKKTRINLPSAFRDGTAVVSYSPAVLTDSLLVSIEFAVDNFPDELFAKVSSAFTALAGLPIFLPFSGYLLGAGGVVKLAGNLGEALFDGHPSFSVSGSIDFDNAGMPIATASFRILADPALGAEEFRYVPGRGLVSGDTVYDGDEPYVVLNLDGKERPELASFAPTAASGAVLQRFFQVRDGGEAATDTLLQGVQLVSDLHYRDLALAKRAAIAAAASETEKAALQAQYDALLKNIVADVMKPA